MVRTRRLLSLLFLTCVTAAGSPCQENRASFALVGATVYDGSGSDPIPNATIVVASGRIVAVGPRAATRVPAGVDAVDVSGSFITPGLVDTHVHYSQTGWADGRPDSYDARKSHPYEQVIADNEAHPERFHRAFLHSGVTAVFDVGGYPWTRRLHDVTEDSPDAPHVAATGALLATWVPEILTLPDRNQFVLLDDAERGRRAVRSHEAAGSDAIKVWFIVRRDTSVEELAPFIRAVGDEARRVGLPLVVHATSLETARVAVEAGCRLLVHSVEDRPVDDSFVAAAKAAGTALCPTLIVRAGYYQLYQREISDEVRAQLAVVDASVRDRVLLTEELPEDRRFASPRAKRSLAQRRAQSLKLMGENLMRLHQAGVPIVLGTDAGNPLTLHGPSIFVEMEAMQAAGLTPREVITASTRDAARAMFRGDDLGLIAAGRIADLLVVAKDPGATIENMRTITHVCRAGVLRPRAAFMPR